jgi:flagellar biosynthesis protein FliQ
MNLSSPVFVIALIVVLFVAGILFATSSKEDGSSTH